uniref:asparagine synthase (glutamine-hydrolyzing) n=2 Tax=Setaria italica TaxID=4555 RepID=K4A6W5_SETIT
MAAHSPWFLHPSTRALAHRLVSFLPPTRTLVPLSPTTTSARVSYHHKSTMCGIFAVLGCADCSQAQRARVLACSRRLKHRGPDWSGLYQHEGNFLAHQRLSVVSPLSGDQPLFNEDRTVVVVANGEIYNHKKIRKQFTGKHTFTTGSDCEVIIALYEEYGENFVDMLDGVFAFVLYDTRNKTFMAARDAIGVNPLYIGWGGDGSVWFSSEMKALNEDCVRFELFPPGHLYSSAAAEFRRWYNPRWFLEQVPAAPYDPLVLRAAFEKAVIKRLMTDAPFGVLLSGGLDSSLVASVTKRHLVETEAAKKFGTELHSFVVGLEGSPDLKAAREVADYLGTIHHEFYFTVQDGIDAIEEVIYHDETYDVTTIRASTPMFLMARKIKSLGVKMVLSGEGSDELLGGYLYFHFAPNKEEFHKETCRKVKALHQYDCLRANKATSAWGLEIRVPFLDKEFVDVAMGMDPEWKMYDKDLGRIEKWVMRKAFEDEENPYLPKHILYRQKEQFSDGVGYSWIDGLKAFTEQQVTDEMMINAAKMYPYNTPVNKEAYYYRMIFERLFPQDSARETVPWGPSIACSTPAAIEWVEQWKASNDPSGRFISSHDAAATTTADQTAGAAHANGNGVAPVANGHAAANGAVNGTEVAVAIAA